ncbi:MAG: sugar-binding protein [bacterium]|nr:sugar-binding protein [bacterium]
MAIWLPIFVCVPAFADNAGLVYYAGEMTPPTIDGDLSDWPSYAVWSTVEWVYIASGIVAPTDAADFTGKFKAGFNRAQNKFYLAIEYTDQDIYTYTPGWLWNGGDYIEVYFDADHQHETVGRPSTLQQYGFKPNGEKILYPYVTVDTEDVMFAISTAAGKMTYEFEFLVYDVWSTAIHTFYSRQTIGFDISMPDYDTDASFSWISWTPTGGKWNNASLYGNMELTAIDVAPGNVLLNNIGATKLFTASGGTPPYTWTSSDTTVGTIDSAGVFTAVNYGTTNISATDSKGFVGIHSGTVNIVATNAPLAVQPKDAIIHRTIKFGELFE